MYNKNWGYHEFTTDVEHVFSKILAAHNFAITGNTDSFSYVMYKNDYLGLHIAYDNSKILEFIFITNSGENYKIAACCLLKSIDFKTPICEFRDRDCILKGLNYLERIVKQNFEQELKGVFPYSNEYELLQKETYFLNKQIAFLPLQDALKQKIKNNYLPNAGIADMRERLIRENNYPVRFEYIYNRYIKIK
ncbi:hypothetical protein BZARG_2800 [Bizionia argentinensis JUB59]|uniref:Uncharacterized protein n=1 Tax=Bizionia argentinensis JUB59 TaxID=1046627 RepID=G2EFI8_9FLAO|nr:hypothetical protein [Bizionia argentinensis]EGV42797.1 hypothetical protein BZARG_2800 [Bizionia argentinensis JUB59]